MEEGVRECKTTAVKKEYGSRERAENLRREPGKGEDCFEPESSMAESRLRAPDLGVQLGVSSYLRKCQKSSPDARRQPFSGKSFYLDLPAGKNLQFLTGAIPQLGGVIEGFLSKEVSYIVSSRREAKAESSGTSHRGCPSPTEVRVETLSLADPKSGHSRPSQKPVDSVPMSRGKELLQKAIRNQGSSSGGGSGSSSSLLTNARSWGVRILHVDEMMVHVQQLSLDALCVKKEGPKKPEGTRPAESRTRKVGRLKAPFLKIEDESRKFRPFHRQFKSFPEISFLGPKDASPFEAPTTLGSSHHTREPKDLEPSPRSAARTAPGRKRGYCECCREAFEELHGHLQSTQHQGFALEAHLYAEVDCIIAQLSHGFVDIPFQASLPRQPGSPASDCDPLCPETPPPSQPSHPRAACPRMREEDNHQVPGAQEQEGKVGGMKAPAEPVEAGEIPGPVASCQELGASADVVVDPPGTPVSRSPTCQHLQPSSGFAALSSGLDRELIGHKRKVQFPSGNAEKRPGISWPQTSFFVPRAPSPCGTRISGGRHLLSLPPSGHEPSPPASPLPLCHPQTCLSLPDAFPWQSTDRPAEFWATQAPWPGGGWPPGSQDSACAVPGPASQQADQLPSCPAAPGQLSAHLHSAVGTQPPEGPAESQSTSLSPPSASQWGNQLLPMVLGPPASPSTLLPCLPAPAQCWERTASSPNEPSPSPPPQTQAWTFVLTSVHCCFQT
ncbi:PREDICTED: protein DBF4 homolog B [Ceratotherium simum simum]|uniref:Protein DBF4 homolog B n=1 Tax=Ceratotherium simum simum TaxID=73337 RepID=A0ABM1CZ95_CERSS|nr:PREDICTED: protein DBF4 homolog B [Ceratotherium simum simum]